MVKKYLENNEKVFCTTRNISKSKELKLLKEKHNNSLEICELDLLDSDSPNILSNFLVNKPIDLFINNAGVIGNSAQHFKSISLNPWIEVLKVNLIAPLLITQSIIKNIEKSSEKRI